jgi:hypothetical protein
MNKSKRRFLGFAALFLILLAIFAADMVRKTTFPGSGKNRSDVERVEQQIDGDTLKYDDSVEDNEAF